MYLEELGESHLWRQEGEESLEQEGQEVQKGTIFTLCEVGCTIKGVVTRVVGRRDLKKRSV